MKLIRFEYQETVSVGVAGTDSYIDLDALLESKFDEDCARLPGSRGSMRRLLEFCSLPGSEEKLQESISAVMSFPAAGRLMRKASECRLLAPIHDPGKIICLGLNYADHAAEQGKAPPDSPMIFAKFATCIIAAGDPVILPARYTQQVDYEVELAVIMGCRCKEITEDQALKHVAGYTIMNDVTARDFQASDKQWVRGKSCDTFAPLGPWIVTADEIPNPHNLPLQLRLNGEIRQNSNTEQMVFRIPYLISYISRCLTLEPGDIISTGTPPGVGVYRHPPTFLKAGDVMEASIEGIGKLCNPVTE